MATENNLFGRDDQVTVINPTNQDFEFAWNSKKYKVPASKVARIPGYMAEHYVKELTNKMMLRAKQEAHLMDENHRKPYYSKIIQDVVSIASFEEAQENPDDVTTLGADTIERTEERDIARAAAGKKAGKNRDKVETLPDDAIDTPIDLNDLPDDEAEIEKEKARLKAERGEVDPDAEPEEEDAFPELT